MARGPLMSGHCAFPTGPEHTQCRGGIAANPDKEWQPCPCHCHLGDEYECECGRPIHETDLWLGDGETTYVHIEPKTGRAVGEVCTS